MTVKLDLTPLIKYFKGNNPVIAQRLYGLTKISTSQSGNGPSLQKKHDIAKRLDKAEEQLDNLEAKLSSATSEKKTPIQDKIKKQKEEIKNLEKMLKAAQQQTSTHKIAQALIEIADELDATAPDLAAEADSLLKDIIKEAQAMEMSHSLDLPLGGDILDQDPEIEDPVHEEPEFDHVSLDDLEDRKNNLKWRVADAGRRDALERALEHGHKSKQYLDAHKKHLDAAHEVFDKAGERLRLKF